MFVNQIHISSNTQSLNLCHRQDRLQQTDVIWSVNGKAHSKLHSPVIQVIMTQILPLTVRQISRHCRRPGKDRTNRSVVCSTSGWTGMLSWPIVCNILEGVNKRQNMKLNN